MYRIVYFQLRTVGIFFLPRSFFFALFPSTFESKLPVTAVVVLPSLFFFTHELGASEPRHFGVKRKDPFFFR